MNTINPQNSELVTRYLDYLARVRQNDPKSVDLRRVHLRRLLNWAGGVAFEGATKIEPFFPVYLAGSKGDHTGEPLSPRFIKDACLTVRSFFQWLKRDNPGRFQAIDNNWIELVRPGTSSAVYSELKEHELYTLEDVRKLLAVPARSLKEKRNRATIAMLFLSGMRISAMLTIPINCIDLESLKISQLPSRGVATKFHKAAVTSLLNIPDLLEVTREWDALIRPNLPSNNYWHALVTQRRAGAGTLRGDNGEGSVIDRRLNFSRHLRKLCARAGIPYRSPHKFRHGHAVYSLKLAKNIEELKAVSQNLMHGSISITDGLYGRLTSDDINRTITRLGTDHHEQPASGPMDLPALLKALAALQNRPDLVAELLKG